MHVLVVDDSAVVRQTVSSLLAAERDITVNVAADPFIAMQKMAVQRPDVILLDVEMPRMDGLTFLRKVMAEDPIPVVICSAVTGPSSEPAVRALEYGALDIVAKPKVGLRDFLYESSVLLVDALRAAAHARVRRRAHPRQLVEPRAPKVERRCSSAAGALPAALEHSRIVAIGASTGGTEALRHILSELPASSPPVLVVQHMPESFTAMFAAHLNAQMPMEVREARHGDLVRAGLVLIAPGNRHIVLGRDRGEYRVTLSDGALVSRHRPSVDVLFHSVAEAAGRDAVGVVLTGMGNDGTDGALAMKQAGATTLAQDEATSVVFGMPREAILRGAIDEVVPLPTMAAAIARCAQPHSR